MTPIANFRWKALHTVYSRIPLSILRWAIRQARRNPARIEAYLKSTDTAVAQLISKRFALAAFHRAAELVPAYRRFLEAHGIHPSDIRTLEDFEKKVPQSRRSNYIREFPIRDLCVGGRLPAAGAVDESAGSTGEPFNWIRGADELAFNRETFQVALRFSFGWTESDRPTILLNTFSCGAWAAGFRLGVSLENWCLVKNMGPDPDRVHKTMRLFGPGERYLLAGYPPFLAELVRFLHARPGFDLKSYRVDVMSGGEGFPAGWRKYMEAGLRPSARLVSAYGASDLEVGIASETPCSKALLNLLLDRPQLRREILGTEREPVFLGQYNPSGHYVRSTRNAAGQNEVEVTTLNPYSVSPRVKFCVGDEGGVLDCEETYVRLRSMGVEPPAERLALPFLFIFGRCDGTVSIDGANIYPDTVASALLEHPLAAAQIRTFKMGVTHTPAGTARLKFLLQAINGVSPSEGLTHECKRAIVQKLLTVNTDFRESYKDNPASADPIVEIVGFDSEHFAANPQKVKNSYFL